MLNWLYPVRVVVLVQPMLVVISIMLAAGRCVDPGRSSTSFSRSCRLSQSSSRAELAALAGIVLACTKILHEFGHGLSCKHFGGECHEMGVMILVLTPCLYCNVSDSWMLPNKWHRAAIGAAGMYVEVVLASICTFIWWFSEPGLLNYICLNMMFVCSVSTILFNANPLLRYDGYYILTDILEIPNLRQKATTILSRKLGKWCLGLEPPDDPFLPQRNQGLFALYTVAAAVYRWVVLFSILYFLEQGLRAVRPEGPRAGNCPDVALRSGGDAAVQAVQVLLRAREVRQSETLATRGDDGTGGGRHCGGDEYSAADLRLCQPDSPAARLRGGHCRCGRRTRRSG